MKASKIAEIVSGKLVGNGDLEISGVADIHNAREGDIIFIENKKLIKSAESSAASVVIVPEEITISGKAVIQTKNPKLAFSKVLELFEKKYPVKTGIDKTAVIDDNCKIGLDVSIQEYSVIRAGTKIGDRVVIFPCVYIGYDVSIGDGTIIYPGVVIMDRTIIGKNVIIKSGTVIGQSGFGYIEVESKQVRIPQLGNVVIEDDVDIGANVTIDRATISSTIIRKGVKIDNLVQIAHNVDIGENSIIISQVGISGSCKIGKNCVLAGQVGIADHAELEDKVIVGAQSGVPSRKIKTGSVIFGYPARPVMEMKRIDAVLSRLPEIDKTVEKIKKKIGID